MTLAQIFEFLQMVIGMIIIEFTAYKLLTPKTNFTLHAVLIFVIQSTLWYLLTYFNPLANVLSFEARMTLRTVVVLGTVIIYTLTLFKDKLSKRILTFTILSVASFVAENMVSIVYYNIIGLNGNEVLSLDAIGRFQFGIFQTMFYVICFTVAYMIIKRSEIKQNLKVAVLFCVMILSLCFILALVILNNVKNDNTFSQIIFLLTIVLSTITFVVLYFIMKKLNEQQIIKEKLALSESFKNTEYQYYENIKSKSEELRKIRHDFRNQLAVVNALITKNTEQSINEAYELIKELDNKLIATKSPVYTQNLIVNTILGIKSDTITENHTKTKIAIDLPDKISTVENIDLNCLFINLIDNAIEAVLRIDDEKKRMIEIKATIKNDYLIVKVKNTYNNELRFDDNRKLKTSKADNKNHGIGTILIDNIAKKYNGLYDTEYDISNFTSLVTLSITQ